MAFRPKKVRKPRGYKLNGRKSRDMCSGCHSFGCDPAADSPEWAAKKYRRQAAGVCVSCGANPCKCKSSLDARPPKYQGDISKEARKGDKEVLKRYFKADFDMMGKRL